LRTTISLDDRLAEQVRRRANEQGLSVSAFIAKTLNEALRRGPTARAAPFRLVTVDGAGPLPGIDLDRPREIEAAEDVARFGELEAGRSPKPRRRRSN
jgi:hypothetical protein